MPFRTRYAIVKGNRAPLVLEASHPLAAHVHPIWEGVSQAALLPSPIFVKAPPRLEPRRRFSSSRASASHLRGSSVFYSLSHATAANCGWHDSSLKKAPKLRNFTNQESTCSPLAAKIPLRERFAAKLRQLLPPSRHRSKLRMPRHLPEEEAKMRILKNKFRKQNHAFALRNSICTRRALIVLRMTGGCAGENVC